MVKLAFKNSHIKSFQMNFDQFLDRVKFYGKIFLAGFAAGLVGFIVKTIFETRSITYLIVLSPDFYVFGLAAGMVWLLTGIVDDSLQQISFMNSFYKQMEPLYYAILGPILLAAVLVATTPLVNIILHPKILKAALKFGIGPFFKALFAGFQSKYKSLFIYYMVRVTVDSIARFVYKKYLDSGNKNVRIFIFTLVAGASAALSAIIAYPIRSLLEIITLNQSISIGISDGITILAMTPVAILISNEFKFIAFIGGLC